MSLIGNPLVSTNYQTNTFSGDGTTVAYTLSLAPASAASIAVYISGLYQTPSVAYTVSGTTLTFTGAPPTGTNNILVLHLGIKSSTLVPVDGSVTPSMLSNANVVFWSGANTNVGIGNTAPNAPLTIGAANGTFTNPLVQAASSANSWLQINAQNKSNGNNASTDLILARSDGNDSVGYIDMGINSNTYAQAAYSIMTPSSGYLFTNGGDLVLGTQTAHNILFHTGNTTSSAQRAVIAANGNVGIACNTPASLLSVGSALFTVGSDGSVSAGTARLDPLGTAINPAPSGRALYNHNPYLPAGLYYFRNSAGNVQQLYCDVPAGGWVLYASNNANDTTIPAGTGRNTSSYFVNRNGTLGALGTASPNSDYLIGSFLDTFAFSEIRGVAYGRSSTNNTYNYSNLGTYLTTQWTLSTTGTNRYNEIVPRSGITISGNSSLASQAAYFIMDGVRADYNGDSTYNANADQSTIGVIGVTNSNGDPTGGAYLGHGTGEGTGYYEGWYDGSTVAAVCQGYTSWCR